MRARGIVILATLAIIATGCNDEDFQKHQLSGNWTITSSHRDGISDPSWDGLQISFMQSAPDHGTYRFLETADNMIWKDHGTWELESKDHEVIFDEEYPAVFAVDGATLIIEKIVPPGNPDVCETGVCMPIVTGTWHFELTRSH